MIFTVVIMGASQEQNLADALKGNVRNRHVYVVGMEEGSVLANALAGKDVSDLADPDSDTVRQFVYSEVIGLESDEAVARAKRRAVELQSKRPSMMARVVQRTVVNSFHHKPYV